MSSVWLPSAAGCQLQMEFNAAGVVFCFERKYLTGGLQDFGVPESGYLRAGDYPVWCLQLLLGTMQPHWTIGNSLHLLSKTSLPGLRAGNELLGDCRVMCFDGM